MPRKKKEESVLQTHLPKILAGLLATGAIGGTGMSYATGSNANERVAVVETKINQNDKDIDKLDRKVEKIDRRSIRIEEGMRLLLEKHGVKPVYGPEER